LKLKVTGQGQDAVGLTSIEDSFPVLHLYIAQGNVDSQHTVIINSITVCCTDTLQKVTI